MVQKSMKVSADREFIASERWKCNQSPSGAHHWIVNSSQMTCKYCSSSKTIDTNRFGWSNPHGSPGQTRH